MPQRVESRVTTTHYQGHGPCRVSAPAPLRLRPAGLSVSGAAQSPGSFRIWLRRKASIRFLRSSSFSGSPMPSAVSGEIGSSCFGGVGSSRRFGRPGSARVRSTCACSLASSVHATKSRARSRADRIKAALNEPLGSRSIQAG